MPRTVRLSRRQNQVRRSGTCRPTAQRTGPTTCKLHTLMRGVSAAGLEAGAVVPSEVVEARLYDQLVLWVEACSKRALLASLLLGLMVRGCFTRVTVLADGQELLEEIPAEDADIPDFAERNLYLQLGRGLPPLGLHSQPSAAVVAVLAAYPTLGDELDAVPRYPQDGNTVDDVGQKLETSFATSLTELFKRRVGQAVALAGARVIAGSYEHQRRFGLPVDGRPAWTERQRSWVAMRYEVARQRRLLGVGQGVVVNKAWRQMRVNRGSLLRHAVDTCRQLEAAHAHHIKLDTRAIYGLMRAAGMLPADITSLPKFRNGVAGPRDKRYVKQWAKAARSKYGITLEVAKLFVRVVCQKLYLQLCRGLPGDGANSRPSAAVAAVLAAHPDLRARLEAIPRSHSDSNMVDHVGKQLETAFSNMLTLLFAGRLKKSVPLAGAKVLVGTHEHQRRFGFRGLGGGHLPAWSKRH
ncbi:hypothetical protein V8C86DRAFT_3141159 [Haematococcus lacustris]